MSGHTPCTCDGARKERMKNWFVHQRNFNLSHFEQPKGCPHYSDYSSLACNGDGGAKRQNKGCLFSTRSKADFVKNLPDGDFKLLSI